MAHLWNGIQLGLALALLIGPVFFALIQAGVERGFRAGTVLASGIWVSDLLYILAVFWSSTFLESMLAHPLVIRWLGVAGSLILIGIGIGTLIARPPSLNYITELGVQRAPYSLLWLKGFAINTFNPFTVFFWISMMTGFVLPNDMNTADTSLFFAGILGTIICTDLLKVVLAKRIRGFLRWNHLVWLRRIAGVAIFVFGIIIIVRIFW